jgi:lysophospholipase L1-like esterase
MSNIKNKFPLLIFFFFFVLSEFNPSIFLKGHENSSGIIYPDNPNIQYSGRFNFSDPHKVFFDWPGVAISAKFQGTACSIILDDYKNEYDFMIDNKKDGVLRTDSSSIYQLAVNLPDSIPHTILIRKRTEAFVGKGIFMGFILDPGKKLLPSGSRPSHRIEFIGNSMTCGYGVEGENPDCHFSIETENAGMSFAAITAAALKADYSLVAYSGRGVVRNYGDSNKVSDHPMPSLYDRTCFFDSAAKWNFSSWQPQAVVINLGTNDFSTHPYPDKKVFQEAYSKLIRKVFSLYPGVNIFCVSGPMIGEPCLSYVKEIVEENQKSRGEKNNLFFIEIDRKAMKTTDWGCDWHPNISGSKKMAEIISAELKKRMNW